MPTKSPPARQRTGTGTGAGNTRPGRPRVKGGNTRLHPDEFLLWSTYPVKIRAEMKAAAGLLDMPLSQLMRICIVREVEKILGRKPGTLWPELEDLSRLPA